MKIAVIALLAIPLLAGCASSRVREEPSMKLIDGAQHYFIKTNVKPCQSSRDWATRTLAKRANEICKSGYTLIDQQTPVKLDPLGADAGNSELLWQIKCKNGKARS